MSPNGGPFPRLAAPLKETAALRAHRPIAVIAALALALGACASGTPAETEPIVATTPPPASAVQDVVLGLQLEPPTLDLTSSPAAAIPQVLLYNVYETLVKLESDGSITPLLAESWVVSDDGTEWTFSLREGLTFHNGESFTADDVVFSLTNVLEKDPAHPFATTLAPISSVEAIDDATVRITLDRFSANFLFFLTQGQGVILTESAVAEIAGSAVGTGPFVFEEWAQGDSIVLRRNARYWGDVAFVETVTYRYINDPNALNNALLAGDIDIIAGVSAPELLEAFEADDRFEVLVGQTNGEVTMALNGSRPPLDDVRVRRAISHAIDRREIVDLAYFGYGELIGTGATPLDPYYVDLTDTYPHDPAAAEGLLADAGYDGAPLRMLLPPVSYARRGGEIVAAQLEAIGVPVEIENVEWGVWLEDVFTNRDYDLSIVAHVEPRDLGQYGNPDYYWAYDEPEVAALLAEADATPDDDARYALLGQVQERITEDAANAWLFLLPALSVTKTGVSGYDPNQPGLGLDLSELAFNPEG